MKFLIPKLIVSETEFDQQNPNPHGAHDGEQECDLLGDIISSFKAAMQQSLQRLVGDCT